MFTGSFHFTELEQSPHVRTGGRAFFHGSWAYPPPPPDSDASSTSSSEEATDSGRRKRPEVGSSSEDNEDTGYVAVGEGEEGFDLEGREDEGEGATVAGKGEKKSNKRRIAWGWPKTMKSKKVYSGGDEDVPLEREGGCRHDGGMNKKKAMNREKEAKKKSKERRRRKKKKQRRTGKNKSQPHGEGYVEFLDGWGVSQAGVLANFCVLSSLRLH